MSNGILGETKNWCNFMAECNCAIVSPMEEFEINSSYIITVSHMEGFGMGYDRNTDITVTIFLGAKYLFKYINIAPI